MGLQISDLVSKKQILFDDLENKKIAVDASQMLYQFLSSIRQQDGTPLRDSKGRITSHLQGLFSRTTNMIQKEVTQMTDILFHYQKQREYNTSAVLIK